MEHSNIAKKKMSDGARGIKQSDDKESKSLVVLTDLEEKWFTFYRPASCFNFEHIILLGVCGQG